ncbi:dUTP diphosphatase [Clostridium sp. Marseille-Q2269]|uniref:dUTP diphosphatase n=1 Tax=Clostridium sp. Marseille-Q2269 TaxID=2942205 RepID=UPI002072D4AF|nr:dUTP diphosphatase [Clostridium sp. Marseille-Q2269]
MNLKKLFELQKNLDEHITKNHSLEGKSLLSEKILALQVELAELANETKCFKYWSVKLPSNRSTILEEYVDCLHFILTLGLEQNFDDLTLQRKNLDYNLTEQFLNLYIDINDFMICSSKDHYITLFEDFLYLGINLGFSQKDIEEAYVEKNNTNHDRQNNGY